MIIHSFPFLSHHMSSPPHLFLPYTALDAVNKPSSENVAGSFAKVAMFAEKFAFESVGALGCLCEESSSLLLSLVWSIYRNPGFDSLKNSFAIQELLSRCFGLKAGASMAVQRVRECATTLQMYSTKFNNNSHVPPGPPMQRVSSSTSVGTIVGGAVIPETELTVARVIHTLQFLIAKHVSNHAIETLNAEGFPAVLIGEVNRFYTANSSKFRIATGGMGMNGDTSATAGAIVSITNGGGSPGIVDNNTNTVLSSLGSGNKDHGWYQSQLSDRLQVIRQFYGISGIVKIPRQCLGDLWNLLKCSPIALDEFFAFLMKGASGQSPSNPFCNWWECLYIFKTFLCSKEVDWSQCSGVQGYECFSKFFEGLRKEPVDIQSQRMAAVLTDDDAGEMSNDQSLILPPILGLDTLWDIVVTLPIESAAKGATELLLQAYDNMIIPPSIGAGTAGYHDTTDNVITGSDLLLERIFDQLTATLDSVETTPPSTSSGVSSIGSKERLLTRVDRLIGLLEGAICRSKGIAGPPHAVRGSMSRISVTVYHRRATSYTNHATQQDVVRTEKGSDGSLVLDVHPLHTVKEFKTKVAEKLGYGTSSVLGGGGVNGSITNGYAAGKVTVEKGGMTWRDTARLSSLDLVDGGDVNITFLTQSQYQLKPLYDDAAGRDVSELEVIDGTDTVHMGQIIANSLTRFDILLALCKSLLEEGTMSGGSSNRSITLHNLATGVVMKIWELLILIPTQPDILKHVEELCIKGSLANTSDWLALLSEDQSVSISRITYTLQIIDNILQPAPEFRTLEVMAQAERFRSGINPLSLPSHCLRHLIPNIAPLSLPSHCLRHLIPSINPLSLPSHCLRHLIPNINPLSSPHHLVPAFVPTFPHFLTDNLLIDTQ